MVKKFIFNKLNIMMLILVVCLLSISSTAHAEGGYSNVRVKFTYGNYYIEFPQTVDVGDDVVVYEDTAMTKEYLRYTIPATGFEEEAYKDFGVVKPSDFEKAGKNLTWKYKTDTDGNLLIYPTYTDYNSTEDGTSTDTDVKYEYRFRWIKTDGNTMPWYMDIPTILSPSTNNGVDIDFTKSQVDGKKVEAWLNTFNDRIDKLRYYVLPTEEFAKPGEIGTYTFQGFKTLPINGRRIKSRDRVINNDGIWAFTPAFPVKFKFASADENLTLPSEANRILPDEVMVNYNESFTAPKVNYIITTDEGKWTFNGFNNIDAVTKPETLTGTWSFTKKVDASTNTEVVSTSDASTNTEVVSTSDASTNTETSTSDASTNTETSTSDASTNTETSTSEASTETETNTNDASTNTETSTSEASTETETNTNDASTNTETNTDAKSEVTETETNSKPEVKNEEKASTTKTETKPTVKIVEVKVDDKKEVKASETDTKVTPVVKVSDTKVKDGKQTSSNKDEVKVKQVASSNRKVPDTSDPLSLMSYLVVLVTSLGAFIYASKWLHKEDR